MSLPVPAFLFPVMALGTSATLIALLFGLRRSLKTAGWSAPHRRVALWTAAALVAAFYVAALLPARAGFYHAPFRQIPTIQYGLLGPIILGIILFRWWRPFRRVVDAVPQQWLAGLQFFRVEGAVFLVLYAMGALPDAFALPAGIGDVLVGLLAPIVAFAQIRRWNQADAFLRAWNFLGILDLVVAITAGMLTSPSPLQLLARQTPNQLISQYPLVMVPVFLVPLFFLLHLASLQRLRHPHADRDASPLLVDRSGLQQQTRQIF
ncbi:MAG: hypothetical protein M3Y50_06655 [Acidobacteriota bacterium]|nr:hypothetical protein [Acidobacteriota bacterium]